MDNKTEKLLKKYNIKKFNIIKDGFDPEGSIKDHITNLQNWLEEPNSANHYIEREYSNHEDEPDSFWLTAEVPKTEEAILTELKEAIANEKLEKEKQDLKDKNEFERLAKKFENIRKDEDAD